MTEHRPGQWPAGLSPVPLAAVPDDGGQPPQAPPSVEVAVPDVRLVVTVDLTGRYGTAADVSRDLYEQTIRASDCHTAIVHVGKDAARVALELGKAIAGRFFLSARHIEVHVPAGTHYAYLAQEVRRYVRLFCADHAQTVASLRPPG